jgi:hypothetical protein
VANLALARETGSARSYFRHLRLGLTIGARLFMFVTSFLLQFECEFSGFCETLMEERSREEELTWSGASGLS